MESGSGLEWVSELALELVPELEQEPELELVKARHCPHVPRHYYGEWPQSQRQHRRRLR